MKRYIGIVIALSFAFTVCAVSVSSASMSGADYVKKKCKACHFIPGLPKKGKKVGGDLAGIGSRANAGWLDKWLTNPKETWAAGGGYTDTLKKAVKGENRKKTKMFAKIKDAAQRKAVVDYLMGLK